MLRKLILSLAIISLLITGTSFARRLQSTKEPAPIIVGKPRWQGDYREPIAVVIKKESPVEKKVKIVKSETKDNKPSVFNKFFKSIEKQLKNEPKEIKNKRKSSTSKDRVAFSASKTKKNSSRKPKWDNKNIKTKENVKTFKPVTKNTTVKIVKHIEDKTNKTKIKSPKYQNFKAGIAKQDSRKPQWDENGVKIEEVGKAIKASASVVAAAIVVEGENNTIHKKKIKEDIAKPQNKNFKAGLENQDSRKPQWDENGVKIEEVGKAIKASASVVAAAIVVEGENNTIHKKKIKEDIAKPQNKNFKAGLENQDSRKPQWDENGVKISDIGATLINSNNTQVHTRKMTQKKTSMVFYPAPKQIIVEQNIAPKEIAKAIIKPTVKPKAKVVVIKKPIKAYIPIAQPFSSIIYKIDESWGNTGHGMAMRQQTLLSLDHKGNWSIQTTKTNLANKTATVFNDTTTLSYSDLQKIQNLFKKSKFEHQKDINSAAGNYVKSIATLTITTAHNTHTVKWYGHAVVSTDEVSPNIYILPEIKALFYILDKTIPRN